MCYGSPAKSLEIARSRLRPEQWDRFEREFNDFCVVQGLVRAYDGEHDDDLEDRYDWARWAFFQGRLAQSDDERDAARYRWLRDKSEPGICAFYLSVGKAFEGVKFKRETVDEAIDAQMPAELRTADRLVSDTYFEKIAIAMMSDEQALASLERWKKHRGESK